MAWILFSLFGGKDGELFGIYGLDIGIGWSSMVGILFVSCVIIWDYGMCIIFYLLEILGKSRLLYGFTVLDMHVVSLKGLGTVQIISFKDSIHDKTTATSSLSPQQPKKAPNRARSPQKQGSRR